MTKALEHEQVRHGTAEAETPGLGPLMWSIAALGLGLAVWAVATAADGPAAEVVRDALILAWALAGLVLVTRRSGEPLGGVVAVGAGIAAVGSLVDGLAGAAVVLLPAVGMHLLLAMPHGSLSSGARRVATAIGYVLAAGSAAALLATDAALPVWLLPSEIALAAPAGAVGFAARYNRASGAEQRRMKWFAWAVTVAGGIAVLALGLRVLVDWPPHVAEFAAAATVFIPLALVLGISPRVGPIIDRLLTFTILLAGLTAVVVAVYVGIVLGLGRVPDREERTLLVLSMVAAGLAALLYLPAHTRLKGIATRLVYGEQRAPDEVLRTFGSRLSRSIPLDELLLQMAESLRKTGCAGPRCGLPPPACSSLPSPNPSRTADTSPSPPPRRAPSPGRESRVPRGSRSGCRGSWLEGRTRPFVSRR